VPYAGGVQGAARFGEPGGTTAARLLGIGRTSAYELVRTGQWPTPVIRVGRLIRVPTAPLLAALGVTDRD